MHRTFHTDRTSTVDANRRTQFTTERSYLKSNTVASVPEVHTGDRLPSDAAVTIPSAGAGQRSKFINGESQKQRMSQMEKERYSQQSTLKPSSDRPTNIQPGEGSPKRSNWHVSKGWTVSRQFPSRTRQHSNRQRERDREQEKRQQELEKRRYQQEMQRQREHERIAAEQKAQQDRNQRIQEQQEEERRRIQEQHRLQEQQRRILEQQRLQEEQREQEERRRLQDEEQRRIHQKEQERRLEEQRRLQEQHKTQIDLYSTEDDDERENVQDWRQSVTQLQAHRSQGTATTTKAPFSLTGPASKTPSLYDSLEEESDYYNLELNNGATTTTAATERMQIPGTDAPGVWPTPFLFEQQVPCAAFSDQVCLQQKKTNGKGKMNKCCDKGVYLTDLCMPGRCTNATIELCCMQKFLQSKYKCCLNDSEAINSPGDAFSRCCFDNFVQKDDKCCPVERARFHWLTAYEICLPNVRVDLSDLRFSIHTAASSNNDVNTVPTSENVITLDLNEDRSWDYSCQQGSNVLQFPYIPNNELTLINENTDESR